LPLLEGVKPEEEKISFNYANPAWPPTNKPWTPEGVLDEYRPLTDSMKANLSFGDQVITVRKGSFKLLLNPASYEGTPAQTENYVLVDIGEDPRERINLADEKPEEFMSLKNDLETWFAEIKRAEHSFEMPRFFIEKGKENEILAKGPSRISPNLQNAFDYLGGWQVGCEATYNIRVQESANFQIVLEFTGEIPADTEFSIISSTGNSATFSAKVDERASIVLQPEDRFLTLVCNSTASPDFGLKSIFLKSV